MQFDNHFNFKRCFLTMLLGSPAFKIAQVAPVPCTNIFPKVFGADKAYNTGPV
jgi:hypothetical protein